MPTYRIKLTRTRVEKSTCELVVDLPTDDAAAVATWAKIAAHDGTDYRHRSLAPSWSRHEKETQTIDADVTADPDFDEVAPAAPLPAPSRPPDREEIL